MSCSENLPNDILSEIMKYGVKKMGCVNKFLKSKFSIYDHWIVSGTITSIRNNKALDPKKIKHMYISRQIIPSKVVYPSVVEVLSDSGSVYLDRNIFPNLKRINFVRLPMHSALDSVLDLTRMSRDYPGKIISIDVIFDCPTSVLNQLITCSDIRIGTIEIPYINNVLLALFLKQKASDVLKTSVDKSSYELLEKTDFRRYGKKAVIHLDESFTDDDKITIKKKYSQTILIED